MKMKKFIASVLVAATAFGLAAKHKDQCQNDSYDGSDDQ